jgi:hypothetical protein
MPMLAVMTDQHCNDCLHFAAEHDSALGCRHAFMSAGERYECPCSTFL